MSEQLNALIALCEQSRAEHVRALKELEKWKAKASEAGARLKALEDAVTHVKAISPAPQEMKFQDRVLEIVKAHDGNGMTAREILDELEAVNMSPTSKNPSASVHMAATELVEKGAIQTRRDPERGKVYLPKPQIKWDEF